MKYPYLSFLALFLSSLYSCFDEPDLVNGIYMANKTEFLSTYNSVYNPEKRINILHISDTHIWSEDSEMNLEEAVKLTKEPNIGLDAIVITGDLTLGFDSKTSKSTVLKQLEINSKILEHSNVLTLLQLGNHDANDNDGVKYSATTKEDQWNSTFNRIANKWDGIMWGDKENGRHYHYYDVDKAIGNLRIIVLDQLDHDLPVKNSGELVYKCQVDAVYSQKQIDWLCNVALQVSPNTGIIICNHFPFMKQGNKETSLLIDGHFTQGWRMIPDIIKAWQERRSINKVYNDMRKEQNIAVQADFSNIDKASEFVCYLVGHVHLKTKGFVEGYEQLYVMENTLGQGKGLFSKVERRKKTETSNAFSALSIDRGEKNIYRTCFGAYIKNDQVQNSRLEIISYKY